jgi:hypothetical protein
MLALCCSLLIRDHSDDVFSLPLMGSMRPLEGKATIAAVRNKAGEMPQARIAFLTAEAEAASRPAAPPDMTGPPAQSGGRFAPIGRRFVR